MKKVVDGGVLVVAGREFVLADSMKGAGHYLQILQRSADQLDAMLSHHCKVLVVRIDLHLKNYTATNKPITDFFRKLRKKVTLKFGQARMGFIWCREHEEAAAQHYHLVLILDGNKNRHPQRVIELIEEIWTGWGHPKPYTPKGCYYLVRRDDSDAHLSAFGRISYLAKVATKGKRPKATNDYGASCIRPKT
ncbi:MAG: inovirus-type Gp2 protein [Amphritea sp.]